MKNGRRVGREEDNKPGCQSGRFIQRPNTLEVYLLSFWCDGQDRMIRWYRI